MRPSNWIKRYVAALKDGDVFTTRCFMGFGSRAAVDQCLYRMVKEGRIIRLARGVFAKKEIPATITLYELAQVKARAFGKCIYEHGVTTASELGLIERPPECVFATDGCTSSFETFKGRIHIKSVSAKKRDFGTESSDPLRRTLKGLWYLGKKLCTRAVIQDVRKMFNNRKGDEVLAEEAATLPHWLIEKFPFRPHLAIVASQKRNAVSPEDAFLPRIRAPREALRDESQALLVRGSAPPGRSVASHEGRTPSSDRAAASHEKESAPHDPTRAPQEAMNTPLDPGGAAQGEAIQSFNPSGAPKQAMITHLDPGGAAQGEAIQSFNPSGALQESMITHLDPSGAAQGEAIQSSNPSVVLHQTEAVRPEVPSVDPGAIHGRSRPTHLPAKMLEKIKWFEPVVSSLVLPANRQSADDDGGSDVRETGDTKMYCQADTQKWYHRSRLVRYSASTRIA